MALPPSQPASGTHAAAAGGRSASYVPALTLLASLFFMWGFITVINNTLLPHLRSVFDLNYTQNLRLGQWINLQIAADFFNVNNRQTGYNYQPSVHDSTFNTPRDYYDPRRFQLAARFRF